MLYTTLFHRLLSLPLKKAALQLSATGHTGKPLTIDLPSNNVTVEILTQNPRTNKTLVGVWMGGLVFTIH